MQVPSYGEGACWLTGSGNRDTSSRFLDGAGTVPAWPSRGDVRLQMREPTGSILAKQAACEKESSTNCARRHHLLG